MCEFDYGKAEMFRVAWQLRQISRACRIMDRALFLVVPLIPLVVYRATLAADSLLFAVYIAGVIVWCLQAPWFHCKYSDGLLTLKTLDTYRKLPAGGHVNVAFDQSGVKWTSSHADCFTPWNKMRQIVITTEFVFLRVAFASYHWIPLRAFRDHDHFVSVLSQLETNSGLTLHIEPLASSVNTVFHRITTGCNGTVKRGLVLLARHPTAR